MYNHKQQLHFIGIGGVGMAGIAEVLLNLGYRVTGSDVKKNALCQHLEALGAKIYYGHSGSNIAAEVGTVIVSSAITNDNSELLAAHERKLAVIPRAEMLAELMRMKYGVAVAGSHGKTTTTSMTAKVLSDCGFDPTVIIGGRVLTQQTGARLGTGKYLVAEADESDGSFSYLRPALAVVTNIDKEHLSYYGSFGALENAFLQFMSAVPFYGAVLACVDDPIVAKLILQIKRRVLTFGFSPTAEIQAHNLSFGNGVSEYDLVVRGEDCGRVLLPMPGAHLISISLAALGVALEIGADIKQIIDSLASFPGVARRSEKLGVERGVTVIDDYAHHPNEISSTLNAIRRSYLNGATGQGRLIALFQPHRYSRSKELFGDFLQCFADADEVIVGEIYSAGEAPLEGVSGEKLARAVDHPKVSFVPDLSDAVSGLSRVVKEGDIVITLGAGDITKIGPLLLSELRC